MAIALSKPLKLEKIMGTLIFPVPVLLLVYRSAPLDEIILDQEGILSNPN